MGSQRELVFASALSMATPFAGLFWSLRFGPWRTFVQPSDTGTRPGARHAPRRAGTGVRALRFRHLPRYLPASLADVLGPGGLDLGFAAVLEPHARACVFVFVWRHALRRRRHQSDLPILKALLFTFPASTARRVHASRERTFPRLPPRQPMLRRRLRQTADGSGRRQQDGGQTARQAPDGKARRPARRQTH